MSIVFFVLLIAYIVSCGIIIAKSESFNISSFFDSDWNVLTVFGIDKSLLLIFSMILISTAESTNLICLGLPNNIIGIVYIVLMIGSLIFCINAFKGLGASACNPIHRIRCLNLIRAYLGLTLLFLFFAIFSLCNIPSISNNFLTTMFFILLVYYIIVCIIDVCRKQCEEDFFKCFAKFPDYFIVILPIIFISSIYYPNSISFLLSKNPFKIIYPSLCILIGLPTTRYFIIAKNFISKNIEENSNIYSDEDIATLIKFRGFFGLIMLFLVLTVLAFA